MRKLIPKSQTGPETKWNKAIKKQIKIDNGEKRHHLRPLFMKTCRS